jgi:NTE family protein
MAAWLDAVGPRAHHLIDRSDARASLRRAARRMAGRALGVTLSGGGARGGAHIGVLEALRESGLEPDRFGGCSIGSFVSGMAARDWTTERMTDVWKEEFVRRSPFSDYAVPRASLLRGRRAERMLQRVFGDLSFEELARPAFAVSADLVSSELVVHQRGLVWEAVAASMAIPGLVPPRRHDGRLLVDGGILDNLPVDVMLEAGEGPVIAIDVMRKPGIPDARAAVDEAPNIVETLARATVLGSADRAARNRELATLTITPDVQDIALRDFARVEHATEAGRSAAAAALERGGKELVRQALEC